MEKFEKKLYSDIGKKLKILAVVLGVIGVVVAIISVVFIILPALMNDDEGVVLIGLSIIVTCIVDIISTWPLYAFGQLVEDVRLMKENQLGDTGSSFKSSFMENELPEL